MKTRSAECRLVRKGQKPKLCAVLATIILGCGPPTAERLVPIVNVEELRSGGVQAGKLLIRMSQSEWEEANVEVVDGVPPATADASLLIFEIPALPNGEFVRFFKPNCPPCYDVEFTGYGWQCVPTSGCIGEGDPPPCAEVRILKDRVACFGSCPDGGNCEYQAVRLRPDFASIMMQAHGAELTAISIEMKDSGFKPRELFARSGVIGYYCVCR